MIANLKILLFLSHKKKRSFYFSGKLYTKVYCFIGVDRFNSIVSSYLVNLYNGMKTKEKEIQVDLYSIDELQVWKENQWTQVFQIFAF